MNRYRKIILLSLKIGIGSSLALYLAEYLGLDYVVSAGTITLLTLMTSKWEAWMDKTILFTENPRNIQKVVFSQKGKMLNMKKKLAMQGLKHGFETICIRTIIQKNIIVYLTHLKRID
jgi:hypothetical protein